MSCDSTLVVSNEVNQVVTDNEEFVVVEQPDNSLIVTDNPFFILTLEEANDIIIVEGVGPKGDPGENTGSLKDPVFTYNQSGDLARIDYEGGSYKIYTYNQEGLLQQIQYQVQGTSGTRVFVYSDGVLQRIEDN